MNLIADKQRKCHKCTKFKNDENENENENDEDENDDDQNVQNDQNQISKASKNFWLDSGMNHLGSLDFASPFIVENDE